MPTVTSVLHQSISFPDMGEFMLTLILSWERDRERSTHMLVPRLLSADLKKELTLRNEKIQLVWFLARQSTSHNQNGQVSGDLWRWEDSWWFTAPEPGPKSGNCGVKILGKRYFLFTGVNLLPLRPDNTPRRDELQHSIVAALLVQMTEWVVLQWETWWRPSRRHWLIPFCNQE